MVQLFSRTPTRSAHDPSAAGIRHALKCLFAQLPLNAARKLALENAVKTPEDRPVFAVAQTVFPARMPVDCECVYQGTP